MDVTTSTATRTVPDTAARAAASALEAIVFREVLKPLAAGLGPVGDIATTAVADTLFARPKR